MRSIRTILVARLLTGGILLFGLIGLMVQWSITRALRAEFDEALRVSAESLQAFAEQEGEQVKMEEDVDDILEFKSPLSSSVFLLREPDGPEIRRSLSLGNQDLRFPDGDASPATFIDIDLSDNRRLRCIALRFNARTDESFADGKSRSLLMIAGRDRVPLELTLAKFRSILLLAGLCSLAALAALLWWGVRRGLRPLEQLVAAISAVDAKTLSTRFPTQSLPTELEPIAARLNELLERLEKVFAREKRFTADVSHELRTPLAELRTLAEVNLMVAPETPADNAACWDEVKSVTSRMESLALRLLELARSEQETSMIRRERVVIHQVIDVVWKRVTSFAGERGIDLKQNIPTTLGFETDPVLFEIMITNLIGNAVHHATPATVFRIDADEDILRFTNAVQDLDPPDLPFLFERFWKKDAARTDGRRHGLGLSLAQEIATLLGGSLTARMPGAATLELAFTLPTPLAVCAG